jgi:putative ABC transport system permease protein
MMSSDGISVTVRGGLKSVSALTAMSFASLPRRLGTASVVVLGIAGVVAVLIAVLAMGTGIDRSIAGSGREDRALVLRAGAGLELLSLLNRPQVTAIVEAAGVKRDQQSRPIASAEALALVELRLADDTPVNVPLRGVSRTEALRPEITISAGRMFRPGVPEIIVGQAAQTQFRNLRVGARLTTREATWEVVGAFSSSGNLRDSELLTDADMVMSAYQRKTYQSVLVQLQSPAAFANFAAALSADPSLQVDVMRESGYYASLAQPLSNSFRRLAYLVGGIMAAGALFATLSCVHAAVSSRAREIATLRALGFGAPAVVCAVILETLLLALLGGGIGIGLCWLGFSGKTLSTSGGGLVQMTYTMAVSAWPIVIGLLWAAAIGVLAGLLPAVHAARQPIPTGLRAI